MTDPQDLWRAELCELRIKLGLSQDELAAVLHVSRNTVNGCESGRLPVPLERVLALRWLAEKPRRVKQLPAKPEKPAAAPPPRHQQAAKRPPAGYYP